MSGVIQEEIDKVADREADIVLGYGLCSNGIRNVTAPDQGLYVPRVHDCIALFLGSRKRYDEQFQKRPGSYYLTPGWLAEEKDPLGILENDYAPRVGREEAEESMREELKHYRYIVFIDTGARATEELKKRAKENADYLGLEYLEYKGSPEYLERILRGPYNSQWFVYVEPGNKVPLEPFLS